MPNDEEKQLLDNIIGGYTPKPAELSRFIDHTILKPNINEKDVIKACDESIRYNFKSLCVPPCYVELAKKRLGNSNTKVISVVSFPFGYSLPETKKKEARALYDLGIDELDIVTNISMIKSKKFNYIEKEIKLLKEAIKIPLKIIVETCYLDRSEKEAICHILLKYNIDYIKTSTGFGPKGAEIEDIKLFKSILDDKIKIKASGGIRDFELCVKMIRAGASRIGSSSSVNIVGKMDVA